MSKFAEFLDEYKEKQSTYNEIIHIMQGSHIDYMKHFQPKTKMSSYDQWQKNHLIDPSFQIIKEPVFIDASVNSIDDLLQIIEKYPYCHTKEYNINIYALHQIKTELESISKMIGMNEIKTNIVEQLLYFLQNLHINDDNNQDYKHTVICGPPGTGKTDIAELLGKMYSKIGILENQVFRKVNRSDLVGGYLGQTALKTRDVIQQCLGGCLFIDEVYSLGSDDSYSIECVNILNEALSKHKNNLMVIIAGYEEEIDERFFPMNKGLESRFIWRFEIQPYSYEELYRIFLLKVNSIGWSLDHAVQKSWFEKHYNQFKNYGRDIEHLLSYIKICHSTRVFMNHDGKKQIDLEDMNNGMKKFMKKMEKKKKTIIHGLYV
jgi:SpoVK/Ycf46/Vps4 family AAA+-type ATPase